MEREAERSMESDSVIVQVPEEANSPANSEVSNSSSSSCSSTESDAELDSMPHPTNTTSAELSPDGAKSEPERTISPAGMAQNHCSELNGLITLTTTTPPSTTSVSCSPPPSDPDEDDMQDLQGDESDVQGTIDSYAPEERMHSLSDPNSQITAVLQNSSAALWRQFDALGTEMIVTRRGRRMFPALKVELFDLDPNTTYTLYMDMIPVDKYRYKYQNSAWVRCFEEECSPTRLYMHPDSPALGSHWMNMVINFYKLKLTNNQLDKQGHIIVNSMHKYQPRLHVVETNHVSHIGDVSQGKHHMFIFPGTQFMTVTAYQNDKITQLKIENNPFAKGFRPPFSRCRGRNQQQPRIPINSTGSESSEDGINHVIRNHRSMVVPFAELRQDHAVYPVVNHRKRSLKPDGPELPSPKQICLGTAVTSPKEHNSPVSICAPTKIFTSRPGHSHGQIVALPAGQNLMFTTTPGQIGGAVSLVQAGSNNQPTLIQTPTGAAVLPTSGGTPVSIIAPNRPASFIPITANGISLSNGHTHAPMSVIQTMAGGPPIRLISHVPSQLTNGSTPGHHQQHQHHHTHHQPLQVMTTSTLEQSKLPITTSTLKRVSPSPPATIHSPIEKTLQFRRSLSSITSSSPPPLVQVIKTETDIVSRKSCSSPPPPPPPPTLPQVLPPHSQLMTIKTVQQQQQQQQHTKPSFEATANPTHHAIPMQSLILPASLQQQHQQQQPAALGRVLYVIAADGTGGGLDTNGGTATLLPLKTLVEAPAFPQNSSFGLPIQILKVAAPNSITTN